MNSIAPFNRRQFLSNASQFTALYALAGSIPFSALASSVADDPRISQTPIADAGFASIRKIGDGLYATISDTSKGFVTICNGGFLVGKDASLLLEAYGSSPGAAFQMDAYRKVTQLPATNALLTHYHFDHSMGSSVYGANGVEIADVGVALVDEQNGPLIQLIEIIGSVIDGGPFAAFASSPA